MNEIRLALSLGAVRALVTGNEIAFQVDEETMVSMVLDDESIEVLRQQWNAYVLSQLEPTSAVQ